MSCRPRPHGLVITAAPPSSVTAGAGFGLSVSVEDAYGNLESGFFGDVTIGLSGGPSGAASAAHLSAGLGGVAAFSGLDLTEAGSGYTISASVAGLTSAQSGGLRRDAGSTLAAGDHRTPPALASRPAGPSACRYRSRTHSATSRPTTTATSPLNLSGETAGRLEAP